MKMIKNIILTITVVVLTLSVSSTVLVTNSYVYAKSAYRSGYDHGCDDANKPYNDRYIAQPGKGAGFHTKAFMDGYNKGQKECLDRNSPINNVPIR